MARQMARPSPTPATVPSVLPRWNLANSCSGSPAGNPGPASSTETSRPSSCLSTRSVMRVPGGVCLAAFSIRLASTCSMSAASTRTSGSSIGRSTSTGCDSRRSCSRRSTAPAISLMLCQSRLSAIAPASSRVISSTLPTRPPICCDCSKMLAASALRSSAPRRSPRSTRLDEAPEITASGVRRSCEIEASRAFLRPSVSASTWARCACSARSARSSAIAIWPAKVSSRWNCSGRSTRRTFAGSTASTPSTACEPFKGRYTDSAEGSVSVPRPAGSPWSCTHCATARSAPRSEPGVLAPRGWRMRPAASGNSTTAWLSNTSLTCRTAARAIGSWPRVAASSRVIA